MREIRLYGSEGGEEFNPLSLPLSERANARRLHASLTRFDQTRTLAYSLTAYNLQSNHLQPIF